MFGKSKDSSSSSMKAKFPRMLIQIIDDQRRWLARHSGPTTVPIRLLENSQGNRHDQRVMDFDRLDALPATA